MFLAEPDGGAHDGMAEQRDAPAPRARGHFTTAAEGLSSTPFLGGRHSYRLQMSQCFVLGTRM